MMVKSDMENSDTKAGLLDWATADPIITDDEGDYPPLHVSTPCSTDGGEKTVPDLAPDVRDPV